VALWIITLELHHQTCRSIGARARYVIATGETGGEGLNHVPGPRIGGVNWVVWAWAIMTFLTFFQSGAMFGGVAWVMNRVLPGISVNLWVVVLLGITLAILLGGAYGRIEKLATLKVCLFTDAYAALRFAHDAPPESFVAGRFGRRFLVPLAQGRARHGHRRLRHHRVGASELFMYLIGASKRATPVSPANPMAPGAWQARARGWIRV
jgi:hypothetical protein